MSTQVDQLIGVLEDQAVLLKKTQTNLKKCPKQRFTKGYIQSRIKCIDEYWNCFKNTHHELLKCTTRDQRSVIPYFANEDFFIHEDLYVCMMGDLKDMLDLCTASTSTPTTTKSQDVSCEGQVHTQVHLPRIQIQPFSGIYEEWPAFKDLYVSLVHQSTNLNDVQKMHFLKTSLTGEAASLLKHMQVTNDNYAHAWETLNHRFGNKRLIVNSLLKRLFAQKKCTSQSAVHLKHLLDTTSEILNSLKNLKVSTDSWDPVILFLVVQKLDPESHKEWEQAAYSENSEELATWSHLKKFLEARFRTLELVSAPATTTSGTHTRSTKERVFHVSAVKKEKPCVLCKDAHILCHCNEFTNMNVSEREEYVKTNKLCFNCLVPGHSAFKCRSRMSCRTCRRRHHTLLHQSKYSDAPAHTSENVKPTTSIQAEVEETQVHTMTSSHSSARQNKIALLATAVVIVRSAQGRTTVLKALIDSGSQACFISEKATQILKLERTPVNLVVSGMESMKVKVKQEVKVQVLSRWEPNFCLPIQAYVMSKGLTTNIPSRATMEHEWTHLENLNLADPNFYENGKLDMLLGVDEYTAILQQGLIKGPPGTPCAQKTHLGWIVMGGIHMKLNTNVRSLTVMKQEVNLDDLLKTIWEIDTDTNRKLTKEENLCEEIYEKTHTRNKDGRYVVKLPFNTDNPKSPNGNSREIAKRRFLQLEKRFTQNSQLKKEYTKVIEEYKELKHIEEVPERERDNKSIYLPHHAVIRTDKETTKTRVVFDASCKNSNGVSLNDELLLGPTLQDDLRSLIMRWRIHAVCFVADIQKMYRMILIDKKQADFQRIIWRSDPTHNLKDMRLLTVTFGTASAPYLAVKTLLQLTNDEGHRYPDAAKILREDFYVDDCMSGCDTLQQAISVSQDLKELLLLGGFELKKWSSNNRDFMKSIKPEDRSSHAQLELKIDGIIKALGVQWNLGTDKFEYSLNLPEVYALVSKRSILSDIQKLFDPLGWIAPSLVMAKILIQKLWLEKVSWDEVLNDALTEEWKMIRADLQNVNSIQVDRWMGTSSSDKEAIEIHGYSDASILAYAAVVYCRVKKPDGTIKTTLIAARTRVAPLKTISLPRLELCGALLLARLLRQVGQAMRIPASQIYAWTDSSIVISWLFGDPNKWKPFVANRVVEITSNVNSSQWYHVQSQDNPADIASRGMLVSNLRKCKMWWNGPLWLYNKEIQFTRPNVIPTELEKKKKTIQTYKIANEEDRMETRLITQFENFYTLTELLRTLTYCRRFLKKNKENIDNPITTDELEKSLQICIKLAQEEEFINEIEGLKRKNRVKKVSKLKSLNPYLDENEILKVGGRLRNADISNDQKHPIILGRDSRLTALIVAEAHAKTLHGGVQLMLTYLRSRYWIIRAKTLVKKHIHRCMVCARYNAKVKSQIMGDLPISRVTRSRSFVRSGVDFAGPFQVLMSRGRGAKTNKAYVALFICMSTKAIHLELVGDLSSAAFIGAFRRFCARRGRCTDLWCDQGRNFVGANKELTDAWKEAKLQFDGEIADLLANDGTQYHHIPAYSPNFGGLWEAGVKSMKYHLKRILTTHLTFEEMSTVLCEIEACLNSRPLCPIESNDDTVDVLTPGHFLIGEALVSVPTPSFKDVKISQLTRWQFTQKLLNDFWSRWQTEYLNRLQQRPKWLKREEEFKIGDIVLIKQDNMPAGKWSLGRITDKHPGPDGLTRVYSVKSGDVITKRCVSKLCALPVNTD